MTRPLRVVVAGMVAGVPGHGGATWAVLQWVLGLRALGHDVLLVEQANASPKVRIQFREIARSFGLVTRAALVDASSHQAEGMRYTDLVSKVARCDVLLNLAGTIRDAELLGSAPRRVYVDLDPGFTQAWHIVGVDVGLEGHDDYVTVGTGVGRPALCDSDPRIRLDARAAACRARVVVSETHSRRRHHHDRQLAELWTRRVQRGAARTEGTRVSAAARPAVHRRRRRAKWRC